MEDYKFWQRYDMSPQSVAKAKAEAFRTLYIWSLPSCDPKTGKQNTMMPSYHYIPDIFAFGIINAFFSKGVMKSFRVDILFDLVANRGPKTIDVEKALMYNEEEWLKNRDYDNPLLQEWRRLIHWAHNHFGEDTPDDWIREFFTEQLKYYRENSRT